MRPRTFNIVGGAWAWTMGAGTLGVGAVALAIGIPVWAVHSGRVARIKHQLSMGQPTVQFDPRTRTAVFGWSKQF